MSHPLSTSTSTNPAAADATARVVVVTGAGSGVGRSVVDRFARGGWCVALAGRRQAPLDETIALLPADAASRCAAFICDVSNPAEVDAMTAAVLKRFGHVDVVVNSAATNIRKRAWHDLSREDWRTVLDTNLHGAFYCAKAFMPGMRERKDGTVININSDAGKVARDLAGAAYVSSKFGLAGLTQSINAEERRHGIRACSIFPRDINTPLLDKRPAPPSAEERERMLQPEDVAECVWLAASLPARAIVEEIAVYSR